MFSDKKAFRREVSISEIVSWLDSFTLLSRVINRLKDKLSDKEYNDIEIHFEYIIKMSKKMRIDFIIKYHKTILLLEMRMVDNFDKLSSTWRKKKMELLIYKDLLNNYLDSDIKVITYAFISLYEYRGKTEVYKHSNYNNNQVNYLVEYIQEFMINTNK